MLFRSGFVELVRNLGFPGLLLIMDELENLRSNRRDIRDKTYNQLREIIDRFLGGHVNGISCIWLGTLDWFEDQNAGVKSYTALYERIKREISEFQTRESVMHQLKALTNNDLEELINEIIRIYQETYEKEFSQNEVKKIMNEATKQFTNLNNEISVSPRQLIKWIVEILDIFKESPQEIDRAIRSVTEKVFRANEPYKDIFA